ncbi:hypothetical protein D9M71_550540 [compost metagenome]
MTRKSAARHISSPPPRARPLIATTVGSGRSSKALKMRLVARLPASNSSSGRPNSVRNSPMSAPTMKASLPLVTITPFTAASAPIAAIASCSSLRVRRSNLLTVSPSRSKFNSAIPSSSAATVMALPW